MIYARCTLCYMSEKGGNLVSSVVLDKHIMGGGDSPLVPKVESRFKTSKDFTHHPLMVPLHDFSINGLKNLAIIAHYMKAYSSRWKES